MFEDVVEPALFHCSAQRTAEGKEARRPFVAQPADEEWDVLALGGPQIDEPPAQQRQGVRGAIGRRCRHPASLRSADTELLGTERLEHEFRR
jgi:hypothetical protein